MQLQYDRDAMLASELGLKQNKQPIEFFCKKLTASDTSTHGGFSVPLVVGARGHFYIEMEHSPRLCIIWCTQRYPGHARLENINHACCGVFTSWVNHGWASLPVGKLGYVLSTVLLICIINTLIKFPLFSNMSWLPSKLCNIRTWSVCNKCRRICVYIDPLIQLNHVRQSLGASSLLSIRFTYMRAVFLAPREWSRWCYAPVACIFKLYGKSRDSGVHA
jgi:hypothetical protein